MHPHTHTHTHFLGEGWEHEWALHKMFLRQAGYFDCMFSGNWRENDTTTELTIHITDINIDVEGV